MRRRLPAWITRSQTDDAAAIANLSPLDPVADTVDGRTAEKLIGKVKPGGVFASVLKTPQSAAYYPPVKAVHVFSTFDRKTLEFMAEAVRDDKLVIRSARRCHSVKRARLMQPPKRMESGRSCWWLDVTFCEQKTREENRK